MSEPALSPEQWANREANGQRGDGSPGAHWTGFDWGELIRAMGPHAGAALLLRGESFGFNWPDVDALCGVADGFQPEDYDEPHRCALLSLANRIAALLPPRETP